MTKRIGLLTSGGDCAGLNAAIRAVVLAASRRGFEVLGIEDGYMGLLERPQRVKTLTPAMFDTHVLRMGGTVLGTYRRYDPFHFPDAQGVPQDRSGEVIDALKKLDLDALIGIGGDGSLEMLHHLTAKGNIPFIGIPKTMDNDIGETEKSIGFDTAVMVATEALDRLQPTAASHDRVMILEVMGRDAGHVALNAGVAGGADIILIPEIPYKMDVVLDRVRTSMTSGPHFCLMIVSEAVQTAKGEKAQVTHADGAVRYGGIGAYFADQIARVTGAETRVTSLGHIPRGAPPTYGDRLLASALGVFAVDMVAVEKFGHMVAWQNRAVVAVPIERAFQSFRSVDIHGTVVKTARDLGICLGDE
jgi:phosphofructokinase-like protein